MLLHEKITMKVYKYLEQFSPEILSIKKKNERIGFVPTMGALHDGHISLIEHSKQQNDCTIVSVYVNPSQFNNKNDFKTYPRVLTEDLVLLNEVNVDIVFTPIDEEMYPEPDKREFEFGELETVMEGAKRPGHFNGVAQIVSKLFDLVQPDSAYFGEKDFQQLAIIRRLVEMMNYSVNIVACPTIREKDGLAMSSRNTLLSPVQRKAAAIIPATLMEVKTNWLNKSYEQIQEFVQEQIRNESLLKLEYFEIADSSTLQTIRTMNVSRKVRAFIAVQVGNVRLIDNIEF